MNVTYEHKPAMTFIGYSTSVRPEEGSLRMTNPYVLRLFVTFQTLIRIFN